MRLLLPILILATAVHGQINRRLATFDDEIVKVVSPVFTVAELPTPGQAGRVVTVTDVLVTTSCTTGGGTKRVQCTDTGTAWVPFDSPAGGSGVWGAITGTLSSQTDLANALNGKAASSHNHAESEVTNLTTDLAGKAAASHAHPISDVTNLQTTLAGKKKLIAVCTMPAAVATSGTGETLLYKCAIAANSVATGDTFRVRVVGNSSSTGTLIFRVRAGANGTTSDNQAWISTTSAAQVANAWAGFEALVTVRSATSVQAAGVATAGAVVLPQLIGAPATAAIASTATWYIDIDATCSSGTFTAQVAAIENI
jgi:hypothetical protein